MGDLGFLTLIVLQMILTALACTVLYLQITKLKALQEVLQLVLEREQLLKDIQVKRKALENPSTELRDFLSDVIEHGCGIIKIAPDSIFIRGMRS